MSTAEIPEARPVRRSSLTRISSMSAAYLMVGKLATMVTVLVLSGVMPLADFGEFMYGRGLVMFFGPFTALGLTVTAMSRLPYYQEVGDTGRVEGFTRLLTRSALLTSVLVMAALVGFALMLSDAERGQAVLLTAIGLPGFALLMSQSQALRALGHVGSAYGPLSIGQPFGFAIAVAVLWAVTGTAALIPVAALFTASMVLSGLWQAWEVRRNGHVGRTTPVREDRVWLRESLPLTLSLAAQGVTALGPLLLLGFFATGEALGIFGFYQAMMQGLVIFTTAIFGAANPKLSALLGTGRKAEAEALLIRSRFVAALVSLVGAIAALGLVMTLAGYIQPSFTTEPLALGLLLGSVVINALAAPLGHVLIIEKRRMWEVWSQLAAALTTIVATSVLAPGFGLTGAAAATFLAAIVRTVNVHWLVYGRLGYSHRR